MVSLRRLRAVALLALTSSVAWAVAGLLVVNLWVLAEGGAPTLDRLWYPVAVFGFLGLLSGAVYACLLALIPARQDGQRFTAMRAAVSGLVSGVGVFGGILLTLADGGPALGPALWFGGVGTLVGLGIHRVASRGRLAPPEPPLLS